jgi:hypothetical protein
MWLAGSAMLILSAGYPLLVVLAGKIRASRERYPSTPREVDRAVDEEDAFSARTLTGRTEGGRTPSTSFVRSGTRLLGFPQDCPPLDPAHESPCAGSPRRLPIVLNSAQTGSSRWRGFCIRVITYGDIRLLCSAVMAGLASGRSG